MFQIFVDTHCATLAGAKRDQPFGPEMVLWKVDGHMFAAYTEDGQGLSVRAKRTAIAAMGKTQNGATTLPFLTGGGWIMLPWDTPPDALRKAIEESYILVRRDWSGRSG